MKLKEKRTQIIAMIYQNMDKETADETVKFLDDYANILSNKRDNSLDEINVEIPIGFMNCGVTIKNNFIADTNDGSNWKTLSFPLPKLINKVWSIKRYDKSYPEKTIVYLTSN